MANPPMEAQHTHKFQYCCVVLFAVLFNLLLRAVDKSVYVQQMMPCPTVDLALWDVIRDHWIGAF